MIKVKFNTFRGVFLYSLFACVNQEHGTTKYIYISTNSKPMEIFQVIQETITKPPIPHEPHKQSLKAWAMYCLRDKGFKVVYAQNADFAIEFKGKDKLYFKVTNNAEDVDKSCSWIVWDSQTKTVSLFPLN
jgi:hypothetical protein